MHAEADGHVQKKGTKKKLKDQEKNIERIERFLEESKDEAFMASFRKELESNPKLAEDVELCKNLIRGLRDEGIRSQLREYHKELYESSVVKKPSYRIYYAIGIAASIILIISVFYLFILRPTSGEQLFETYFMPYPNLMSTRGTTESLYEEGMEYYSQKNYEKAIQLFEEVEKEGREHPDLMYYKGIAQLAAGQTQQAINSLETLIKTDKTYSQQASWYLSLAYLKLGDIERAKNQLNSIKETHYKYVEARQILEQIE